MSVRVRFAPSPTGYLHIGGLKLALYNYLLARQQGGAFILRIEDTDRTRYVADGVANILNSLAWAGILPDEGPMLLPNGEIVEKGDFGPYTQSTRLPLYKKYADELLAKEKAYYCFCNAERLELMRKEQEAMKQPPKYDKHCLQLSKEEVAARLSAGEKYVIRLNVAPGRTIVIQDLTRGEIRFPSDSVDDQVLMKSDGFPTYHLANVVDDHLMEITHVIRGEEWVSSTPKHVLLYEAFGWQPPQFAHQPLLLNPDRSKLSKRQGDVAAMDYAKKGYLPEAMVNFIALLGWNPSDSQEIYSVSELIEKFDLTKVGKSGAVFNLEKLDWINGHYLRAMPLPKLKEACAPFFAEAGVTLERFADADLALESSRERATTLVDIATSLQALAKTPDYDPGTLVWKKSDKETAKRMLSDVLVFLHAYEGAWQPEALEGILKTWITETGRENGAVLWPLRVALSGQEKSPPPFDLLVIFGKAESLARIEKAIALLS